MNEYFLFTSYVKVKSKKNIFLEENFAKPMGKYLSLIYLESFSLPQ